MGAPEFKLPSSNVSVDELLAPWNDHIDRLHNSDPAGPALNTAIEQAKLIMLAKIAIELEKLNKRPAR